MKQRLILRNIEKKKVPIVDISLTLPECVKAMGKSNLVIAMARGYIIGIIKKQDILQGFLCGDENVCEVMVQTQNQFAS